VFASQVKALMASGLVQTDLESAGLASFYLLGSVQEPWTLFKGVLSLPPGSWMRVRQGEPQGPVPWWDVRDAWKSDQTKCSRWELQERVRAAVTDSVRVHLVSDVPVSVFLSGGIDSASVTALVAQLGAKVEGITIGFQEFEGMRPDEVPVAASIASHYGFDHHIRQVCRSEFEQDLPRFIDAMDQPTIDGVNTWFASKAAAERGYKVVLSGLGGDELFYGYSLTREISRSAARNRAIVLFPGARSALKAVIAHLPVRRLHPKLKGIPEFIGSLEGEYLLRRGLFLPHELPLLMEADLAREGMQRLGGAVPGIPKADAVNGEGAVCMLDSTLYMRNMLLRDSDWASMAHSLELRTPLVDVALLQALKSLHAEFTDGAGKQLLAKSPLNPLPYQVVHRQKTGFTVPMTQWLADATERLTSDHSRQLSLIGTPWTRRWARVVIESFFQSSCGLLPRSAIAS